MTAAKYKRTFLLGVCGGAQRCLFVCGLGLILLQAKSYSAVPLVVEARKQVGVTVSYDPAYVKIKYPGGDVPLQSGVCSDVVIRAFRGLGVDLQKEVHEDMVRAFDRYPQNWGLSKPDANIDHRRVPNLMAYFRRKGWSAPITRKPADFQPGDVVAWDLGGGITHIGIVSDRQSSTETPLAIHNIGAGAREEDVLFQFKIIGHYRPIFRP